MIVHKPRTMKFLKVSLPNASLWSLHIHEGAFVRLLLKLFFALKSSAPETSVWDEIIFNEDPLLSQKSNVSFFPCLLPVSA